jgi:hypothetical protein
MPQFFVMGNTPRHYFCYIVSNFCWQYLAGFCTVTLLVIYSCNRCIYGVSRIPLSHMRDRMVGRSQPKLLLEKALV